MICAQSVVPVRVGDGAVRGRDGAAIVIHWQGVDCARVGNGAAVPICKQDVRHVMSGVSCHDASCHVATCRVMSSGHVMLRCYAASCRLMSGHVASCHLCNVMSCHVTSRHVTSRYVKSSHAVLGHVMSVAVLSYCVVSRLEKQPQHIDTATSLSHYANARRSHAHSSYSYHSCSDSLHSHHSHSCTRVVLSTSHSFRFFLLTHVFYLSFRCGVIRSYYLLYHIVHSDVCNSLYDYKMFCYVICAPCSGD